MLSTVNPAVCFKVSTSSSLSTSSSSNKGCESNLLTRPLHSKMGITFMFVCDLWIEKNDDGVFSLD